MLKLILEKANGYFSEHITDQYYFDCLDKALDVYSSFEKVILTGDFNAQDSECMFDSFLYQHDLANLVKKGTCYKNPRNPSCYI